MPMFVYVIAEREDDVREWFRLFDCYEGHPAYPWIAAAGGLGTGDIRSGLKVYTRVAPRVRFGNRFELPRVVPIASAGRMVVRVNGVYTYPDQLDGLDLG